MRTSTPRAENGHRAERPKSLLVLSISICLRLEFIAILSGLVSRWEIFPAPSCDAISPGGRDASAGSAARPSAVRFCLRRGTVARPVARRSAPRWTAEASAALAISCLTQVLLSQQILLIACFFLGRKSTADEHRNERKGAKSQFRQEFYELIPVKATENQPKIADVS
jgi:hypothetical protein